MFEKNKFLFTLPFILDLKKYKSKQSFQVWLSFKVNLDFRILLSRAKDPLAKNHLEK